MKLFQDRIWLVLLGVAVAILVTLTTVFWNEPSARQSGTDGGSAKPATPRTLVPKITTQVLNAFTSHRPIKK